MPKSLYLLFLFIPFFACLSIENDDHSQHESTHFSIIGDLDGFPDSTKIYLTQSATESFIDSTFIVQNTFQFEGSISKPPEQYIISGSVADHFFYQFMFIGNEQVQVSGALADFPWDVKVTGSIYQDDQNILDDMTRVLDKERDSLVHIFLGLDEMERENQEKAIWGRIRVIDSLNQALRFQFIEAHPDSYVSVIHLGYLKNKIDKSRVRQLYQNFTQQIKESKFAKMIQIHLEEEIPAIGDRYHDFIAENQHGDEINFSELFKGKYVLLDFTAAYCGPCIQAAEELQSLQEKHFKHLKIVSFSGDVDKSTWLKSLKRTKLPGQAYGTDRVDIVQLL